MSVVAIDPNSAALGRLRLGGVLMPGVIEPGGISGWAKVTKYTVTAGKGSDGGTLQLDGDDVPKGKVVLTMWTDEQLREWATAYQTLRAAREAKLALDIVQPLVNSVEVTSVVVESIGQVTDEGGGKWTVALSMIQWLPEPKASPSKPSGSASDKDGSGGSGPGGSSSGGGTAKAEETKAEKEFKRLAEEAAK